MESVSEDPIYNAIIGGIKGDISFTYDHQRFRACVILIYTGMDAMAWLSMPADKVDVTKADFVAWADSYIRFPCEQQVTGADFYGARCSMLHGYSVWSQMSRGGKCRVLGYSDKAVPEVIYRPEVSGDLVMVSIYALKEAFFSGIDKFLVDAFSDPQRGPLVERRLNQFIMMFDTKNQPRSSK